MCKFFFCMCVCMCVCVGVCVYKCLFLCLSPYISLSLSPLYLPFIPSIFPHATLNADKRLQSSILNQNLILLSSAYLTRTTCKEATRSHHIRLFLAPSNHSLLRLNYKTSFLLGYVRSAFVSSFMRVQGYSAKESWRELRGQKRP